MTALEIRILAFCSSEHEKTLALRRAVLGQPGCPPFAPTEVEAERNDVHVGLFDGSDLVGCLVLTHLTIGMLQVRQVSVRPDCRRQGCGTVLMTEAERYGRDKGYRLLVLYARDEAAGFYRALGYRYHKEWPPEAGIPIQMSAKAL